MPSGGPTRSAGRCSQGAHLLHRPPIGPQTPAALPGARGARGHHNHMRLHTRTSHQAASRTGQTRARPAPAEGGCRYSPHLPATSLGHLGAWRAETLTAEDLVVAPPEVCGSGRPVVELVPVGSQDEPEERARRRVSRELERLAWAGGLHGTAAVFLSLPRRRRLSSQAANPQEGESGLGPAPLPGHQVPAPGRGPLP